MGHQRVIIDIMTATDEAILEVTKKATVTFIDAGMVITKCKIIRHPDQDDEKHTTIRRT